MACHFSKSSRGFVMGGLDEADVLALAGALGAGVPAGPTMAVLPGTIWALGAAGADGAGVPGGGVLAAAAAWAPGVPRRGCWVQPAVPCRAARSRHRAAAWRW